MAVPSGAASLQDIADEFGGSTPHSLSEYYSDPVTSASVSSSKSSFCAAFGGNPCTASTNISVSHNGNNIPDSVPTSGTISINDFRGKSKDITYQWEKVSGSGTISNANNKTCTVSYTNNTPFSTSGVFRCKVYKGGVLKATSNNCTVAFEGLG